MNSKLNNVNKRVKDLELVSSTLKDNVTSQNKTIKQQNEKINDQI